VSVLQTLAVANGLRQLARAQRAAVLLELWLP